MSNHINLWKLFVKGQTNRINGYSNIWKKYGASCSCCQTACVIYLGLKVGILTVVSSSFHSLSILIFYGCCLEYTSKTQWSLFILLGLRRLTDFLHVKIKLRMPTMLFKIMQIRLQLYRIFKKIKKKPQCLTKYKNNTKVVFFQCNDNQTSF